MVKKGKWLLLSCTLLLVICFNAFSQTTDRDLRREQYGLVFASYEVLQFARTSLPVINGTPIRLTSLQFDLALHSLSFFGYIFRAKTVTGDRVEMILSSGASAAIKVIINGQPTELVLPIDSTMRARNYWHDIHLTFKEDSLELRSRNGSRKVLFQKNRQVFTHLIFGKNSVSGIETVDIPPFALRNLQMNFTDGSAQRWSMDETEGEEIVDEIDGRVLKVRNPIWLTTRQSKWLELTAIRSGRSLNIAYDPLRQQIKWVQPDKIITYHVNETYETENSTPLTPTDFRYSIYNRLRNELTMFDIAPKQVSILPLDSANWQNHHAQPGMPERNLWLTAPFINPLDSNLMLLGGYGFFTMKNQLHSYDQALRSWSEVPLKGSFAPRYHHAVGKGFEEGQWLVFGGIGNESGKQELGLKNYYDLHLMDMRDSTITRLWEIKEVDQHFVPAGNLVLDVADSAFYVLTYANFASSNNLSLYRVDLRTQAYQLCTDELPFVLSGFDTSLAGLYHDAENSELIAYTIQGDQEESTLRLYSLLSPPMPVIKTAEVSVSHLWEWLYVAIVAVLILLFWYQRKSGKPGSSEKAEASSQQTDVTGEAIFLFGEFTVIDQQGDDITTSFSPKIRELFLLLLLNRYGNREGVKTQAVHDAIWPGHDKAQAKNAKGVSMKRLRSAIGTLTGAAILFEENKWKLELDQAVYTDLESLHDLLAGSVTKDSSTTNSLLRILKRGPFLAGIKAEWLDQYRGLIHLSIVKHLTACYDVTDDHQQQLDIADAILQIDDLHETGIQMKIKTLIQVGNHGMALSVYEDFCARYQTLYGEEFPHSFKEISEKSR